MIKPSLTTEPVLFALLLVGVSSCVLRPTSLAADDQRTYQREFNSSIQPLLNRFCYDCHGRKDPEGDIDLKRLGSWQDLENHPLLVERMIQALRKIEMPPEDNAQLTIAERKTLVDWLEQALRNSASDIEPAPFRLRRMNRFEYGNAVRDLFDLESWVYSINDRIIRDHNNYFRPETGKMPEIVVVGNRIMGLQQLLENRLLGVMAFPKDAPAENGFNNRGDHLSLTPVLMQSFMELSRSVVNAENFDKNCRIWKQLFEDPANPQPTSRVVSIPDQSVLSSSSGVTMSAWIRPSQTTDSWQTIVRREDSWRRQLLAIGRTGDIWGLWIGVGISGRYEEFGARVDSTALRDGELHHVAGTYDGKQLNLYVDGELVGSKQIVGELYTQSTRPMEIGTYNGEREPFHGKVDNIRLFGSGLSAAQIQSLADGAQNVAVDQLVGSWKSGSKRKPKLSEPMNKIAHQRIRKFLSRAFRQPTDKKTSDLYIRYFDRRYQKTGDFTQSIKDVVSAALASPRFILVHNENNNELPHLRAYNLATRLSFFLWSSIPDDELLSLAAAGTLHDPEVLKEQVDRMLNDRRVKNFCDSFAPQWLRINNLVSASPDFKTYRDYYFGGDDKISYKRGMHMMLEPLLNFETVFVENRPITELIDADFTYRSHLLSEWYRRQSCHLSYQRELA